MNWNNRWVHDKHKVQVALQVEIHNLLEGWQAVAIQEEQQLQAAEELQEVQHHLAALRELIRLQEVEQIPQHLEEVEQTLLEVAGQVLVQVGD
jgi:hypothetical protein